MLHLSNTINFKLFVFVSNRGFDSNNRNDSTYTNWYDIDTDVVFQLDASISN